SGIYTWYELILGTFLGCIVLASIVLFLTESASLSHILASIPAWLILLILGLVVLADLA
ncbi:ANK_REP_REGION domain-containing protein, partial [Durusdinium trenchii]